MSEIIYLEIIFEKSLRFFSLCNQRFVNFLKVYFLYERFISNFPIIGGNLTKPSQ